MRRKNYIYILIVSIILNAAFISGSFLIVTSSKARSFVKQSILHIVSPEVQTNAITNVEPNYLGSYYLRKTSQFDSLPLVKGQVVFVGDSLTDDYEWNEAFQTVIVNRGVGGDTTIGLCKRIQKIAECKPAKIFIMIGIVDIAGGEDNPVIIANYREILQTISNVSPSTKIYIQSILPINWANIPNIKRDNNDIIQINGNIEKIAKEYNAKYIDLYSSFVNKNGDQRLELFVDGQHLNGQGYLLWRNSIESMVKDY